MSADKKLEITTLSLLAEGTAILYGDRSEPVMVADLETNVNEASERYEVRHRAYCDGPRGGDLVLEELDSGRIRSHRKGGSEGRTVDRLRYARSEHAEAASGEVADTV